MAFAIRNVGIDVNDLQTMKRFCQVATENRFHIDVATSDVDQAAAELERTSASRFAEHGAEKDRWIVLTDSEGNQFCVVPG